MRHDAVELSVTLSRQSHRRDGVSLEGGPMGSFEIRRLFNIKGCHTACPTKDQLRPLERECATSGEHRTAKLSLNVVVPP